MPANYNIIKYCFFSEKKTPEPIRDLFAAILQAKCPVITHNGLIDLAFLYQVISSLISAQQCIHDCRTTM